jgi:hypothetical protein
MGVTGYLVERENPGSTSFVQIGTATGTTYSDTGLMANSTYTYRVRATDAAGNLSGYSNMASNGQASGVVNFVDFETGNFSQTAAHTGGAIVPSPVLAGMFCLQLQRMNSVANCEIRQSGATYYNLATVYYSFLFEFTSNPGEGGIVNFQDTSSGYKAALHLSSADKLLFYDNSGLLLATGSTTLTGGQVNTISAKIGTGSNAAYEIRINGTVEMSGSGNLGAANNGSVKLGGNNTYTATYYYDSVAINSQGYPAGGAAALPVSSGLPLRVAQAVNADRTLAGSLFSANDGTLQQTVPVLLPLQAAPETTNPFSEAPLTKRATGSTAALDSFFAGLDSGLAPEGNPNP